MSLPIIFLPEARAEFDAAADWYDRQRPGLGIDFIAKVSETLERIAENPELYRAVHREARRALVSRFPYGVIYRTETDRVLIIAVLHGRRDPGVWKSRL